MAEEPTPPEDSTPATPSTPTPEVESTSEPEAPRQSLLDDDEGAEDGVEAESEPEAPPPFEPMTQESLTLPEGFEAAPEDMASFLDTLNAVGSGELPIQEAANQLISLQASLATRGAEALNEQWTQTIAGWEKEIVADPVIGGDALEPTLAGIKKMISDVADEGLSSSDILGALSLTGAGINPAIIKFLSRVSAKFQEGTPASGEDVAPKPSLAQRLYPTMRKEAF